MKQIRWIWSLTKKKRGMILGLLVLVSVIAVFQVCLAVAVQLIVDKAQVHPTRCLIQDFDEPL